MIYLFFLFIFPLLVTLLFLPFCAKIYVKAGKTEADAKAPIKNILVWLDIIKKPKWWLALFFVPVINYLNVYTMIVDMLIAMGEKNTWKRLLAGAIPFPFLLKYNDESWKYIGPNGVPVGKPAPKKETWREWTDSILYAVIAATAIRMLFFEAYTIPTSSMEKTLRVGDFLFVSKFHYGARLPNTPLAFPFAHHTMPVIGTQAYSELIHLPYYRLPGFQTVKRNDMVVFNFPAGDTLTKEWDSQITYYDILRQYGREETYSQFHIKTRPVDKRENYIKRCVAVGGDSVKVINDILYLSGEKAWEAPTAQFSYLVTTNGNDFDVDLRTTFDFYDELEVVTGMSQDSSFYQMGKYSENADKGYFMYRIVCNKETIEEIKKLGNVKSVVKFPDYKMNPDSLAYFPNNPLVNGWTVNNYGSLWIPKKGATIQLNPYNYACYARAIVAYEGNTLVVENGKYILNGQPATSYTFKMNYYWMMGDNRNNSQDSRYWGYVPEDHIVGKAWVIWMSKDNLKGIPAGIRFNRIGTFVHSKYVPH
jgi:signal peptidase I